MSEQPTIGKIEQLTTLTEQERIDRIKALRGKYANQLPPSDQRDKEELDTLRAEVARLREALAKYADHDNWVARPVQYSTSAAYMAYDIWEDGHDVNGWETAEAALGNKKDTP